MKKSQQVAIGAVLLAAVSACRSQPKDEWTTGADAAGRTRDTNLHGHGYRHYGGFWYPIIGGFISPNSYNGATAGQIARPGYNPTRTAGVGRRAGGFGRSARSATS